jgi:hypothetical protein
VGGDWEWDRGGEERRTAVTVSMQRTKGSENMYLESESEYSFHSWPKKSVMLAIRVWFNIKYPSKKKWIEPPVRISERKSPVLGLRTYTKRTKEPKLDHLPSNLD